MRLITVLLLCLSFTAQISAAELNKAELKTAFDARAARLTAAKAAGTIGETTDGLVAAVQASPDATVTELINAENADRTRLYQVLAQETNSTPALVGERNAMRNYQNAAAGAWLRTRDGQWKKK